MRRRRSAGQTLVEFAFITPILLLLLLLILDLGRGIFLFSEMSAAAREAARQAVLLSNEASNTASPGCDGVSCQTPGVIPQVRRLAGFGVGIVYADSTSLASPPSYGTYAPPSPFDPDRPGTITLTGQVSPNTVYVFVYQVGSATSPSPRWACPSCDPAVRTGGHQKVVVDLKMVFRPVTMSFSGSGGGVTVDAQTVERMEY